MKTKLKHYTKTITGKFDFEVVEDGKHTFCPRMNCKGLMVMIERSIKNADRKLLLEEYAKYWLADKLRIKYLPLKK